MHKLLLAAVLATATFVPASAHATQVANIAGFESCAARSVSGTHSTCVFVARPGTYQLSISLNSTYGFGWSKVTCQAPGGAEAFVSAESPVTYASTNVVLPGGVCTLEVFASQGIEGYGSVTRIA
jgi:hypothetical protein